MESLGLYREPVHRINAQLNREMGNKKNKINPEGKTRGSYNKRESKGMNLINNIKCSDWINV